MLRSIVALICGVIAGSIFNMAIVMLSWVMYPLPDGANTSDPATMKMYIQSLPAQAFLVVLAAHAGGALVGGLVAALIARKWQLVLGAIVGGFFLIGGIMNILSLPCPVWFAVADLVLYVPCGFLGADWRRAMPPPLQPSSLLGRGACRPGPGRGRLAEPVGVYRVRLRPTCSENKFRLVLGR